MFWWITLLERSEPNQEWLLYSLAIAVQPWSFDSIWQPYRKVATPLHARAIPIQMNECINAFIMLPNYLHAFNVISIREYAKYYKCLIIVLLHFYVICNKMLYTDVIYR